MWLGPPGSEGAEERPLTCTKRSFSSLSMRTGSRTGRGRGKAMTPPLLKSDHRLSGSPPHPEVPENTVHWGEGCIGMATPTSPPSPRRRCFPHSSTCSPITTGGWYHGPRAPFLQPTIFQASFVSCSVTCPCWRQNQGRELNFSTTISSKH